eukprot:Phypoly_transcript_00522.p1 GENE.Phypoly_transcript_00522~~Phypoly_transcript_00522.p1  ORF type:complete len:633 (+),score=108.30 Phypoly_transcript_00522:1584-3482(+)
MSTPQSKTSHKSISCLLFDADPSRIAQKSEQDPFDVIVVGSGMGGGVLAHRLAESKQRVLLLERGDLLFTTHALNTTRPHADLCTKTGPTQDNDIVYGLLKEKVRLTDNSDKWSGGPVYCLGGRSNAWGLYIPRIDHKTLEEYFPPSVVEDLHDNKDPKKANYYKRAEFLMQNKNYEDDYGVVSEPLTMYERLERELHKVLQNNKDLAGNKELVNNLIEAIHKDDGRDLTVDVKPIADKLKQALKDFSSRKSSYLHLSDLHWALLGAQFNAPDHYEFPQGAFSSTDRILETVFRSHQSTNNKMQPPFLTALHNTLAIELVFDGDSIKNVKTLTASGSQQCFYGKNIVLCAGTIDSPALLLRSGIEVQPQCNLEKAQRKEEKENGEKKTKEGGARHVVKYSGVTDHNIYGFRFTIKGGGKVEAAKLQLEGEVCATQAGGRPGNEAEKWIPFLLNICINTRSFLAREFDDNSEEGEDGMCTLTYEFRAPLNNGNYVALDVYTGEPILHIKNSGEETVECGKLNPHIKCQLSELNIFIEETIRHNIQSCDKKLQLQNEKQIWKAAGLGCVAHEIGTLPMSKEPEHGVVDSNLKFHKFSNLYACDMSVFPVSAPANPSLTLVALALRLSDHLSGKE